MYLYFCILCVLGYSQSDMIEHSGLLLALESIILIFNNLKVVKTVTKNEILKSPNLCYLSELLAYNWDR